MNQVYGRLTIGHLRQLIELVPVLEALSTGVRAEAREDPNRFRRLTGASIQWSSLYELPIQQHIEHMLAVAGLGGTVKEAIASSDPVQVLIDLARADDAGEWSGGLDGQFKTGDLVAVGLSVDYTMQCLMLYGTYINELIASARGGDDKALLKAIRIDLTVVCGPTASGRIGRAVAENDGKFLKALRLAMQGKTGQQARYLRRFRFAIRVLAESGAMSLPTRVLEELTFELGLYEDRPGSRKNVRELIRKAVKANAISK